jgi:hypothetical protein
MLSMARTELVFLQDNLSYRYIELRSGLVKQCILGSQVLQQRKARRSLP